jgi:adenine-specific DNA-methyltransferase
MVLEKKYIEKVNLSHRKKFAQFFTPETIADLMSDWLIGNEKLKTVLEPAFGLGVLTEI